MSPSAGTEMIMYQKLPNLHQRFRFRKIHPKKRFCSSNLSKLWLAYGKASGMSMIPNKILRSTKHTRWPCFKFE